MVYEKRWLEDKHILHVRYMDSVSVLQADELVRWFVAESESIDHIVHVIVDYTANPHIEFSIRQALESEEARLQFSHPKAGWTVVIADKDWHFYYLFISVLEDKLEAKVHMCGTFEEALAFLHEDDESLPVGETNGN